MYKEENLNNRLHLLDALRFLAALSVMMINYGYLFNNTGTHPYFKIKYIVINVLFIIIIFVIFNSAANASPLNFLSGRFARLMPAFLIASIFTLVVSNILGDYIPLKNWMANLTFYPAHLFGENFVDGVY